MVMKLWPFMKPINFTTTTSKTFQNAEKLNQIVEVKIHYAYQLYYKSHFDKLTEIIDQISELLTRLGTGHTMFNSFDQHHRFLTGMLLSNQNEFQKAYPIFKQLHKEDPEHHYYRVWRDHTRFGLYKWIFRVSLIVGTVLIFADLLFSLNELFVLDLGYIGIVIVIVTFLLEQAAKEYFKSKKKATNKQLIRHVPWCFLQAPE